MILRGAAVVLGFAAAVSWFGRQVFLRPSLRMVQAASAAAVKADADAPPEGLGLEGREHATTLIIPAIIHWIQVFVIDHLRRPDAGHIKPCNVTGLVFLFIDA